VNTIARSLLVSALAAALPAQDLELVWQLFGTDGTRQIGLAVEAIGDLDLDGHEDLLTIVSGSCGLPGWRGALWLVSGRTGAVIREVLSAPGPSEFEEIAAAGDMNGDGIPDYAVTHKVFTGLLPAFWSWFVEVRSGADDSVLWSVPRQGWRIISDLDVDGDGRKDLVVSERPMAGNPAQVYVYRHGGQELYRVRIDPATLPGVGKCLVALGDVDDDGADDFAMSVAMVGGNAGVGIVSGRSGRILHFCLGEFSSDVLNYIARPAGDLDGDGYTDLVVGNGGFGLVSRAVARAFSGRTGAPLHQWVSFDNRFSISLAARGVDLDGDGIGDVVVGSPIEFATTQQSGAVYGYSGRDGSQLFRLRSHPIGGQAAGQIGYWVTTLRPPVGEHLGLVVVSDENSAPSSGGCLVLRGSIRAYRGLPRTSAILGSACAGTLPAVPNIGMQSLGTAGVRVHVSEAPANALCVLLVGLSTTSFAGHPLPLALDPIGFPGCSLRTAADVLYTAVASSGPNGGHAAVPLALPVPPTGAGTWTISAQWMVLGDAATWPGGFTQAITWRR
jgi:hypothetical protein